MSHKQNDHYYETVHECLRHRRMAERNSYLPTRSYTEISQNIIVGLVIILGAYALVLTLSFLF